MNKYQEMMKDFVCIVSTPFSKFSMLQEKYQCLRRKKEFLYKGKKNIYRERNILSEKVLEQKSEQEEWFVKWYHSLEEDDGKNADQELKKQLEILRTSMEVWRYSEYIRKICHSLEEMLKKKKLDPDILKLKDSYTNAEELEKDLLESQKRYMEELQKRRVKQYSRYVILTQEYIRNFYDQDISIADIAQSVGISEGHLRRCFKNEMNMKLVNYLMNYRIECAKRMMKNSKENIDEIWKKTGFTSGQYFSYAFKKKEGITPREYMRKANNDIDE